MDDGKQIAETFALDLHMTERRNRKRDLDDRESFEAMMTALLYLRGKQVEKAKRRSELVIWFALALLAFVVADQAFDLLTEIFKYIER